MCKYLCKQKGPTVSMNQPRSSSALAPRQAVVMPPESAESLLTPSIISRVNKVVLQQSKTPEITTVKLPLPFEDIPGPAVLRLIEKYWKYVPILGTQLVCRLLLNTFTVGMKPRVEIFIFNYFFLLTVYFNFVNFHLIVLLTC